MYVCTDLVNTGYWLIWLVVDDFCRFLLPRNKMSPYSAIQAHGLPVILLLKTIIDIHNTSAVQEVIRY